MWKGCTSTKNGLFSGHYAYPQVVCGSGGLEVES
jgi:hypothetical protein